MFSAYLRLSTSTSKLPFLVFLTVFGVALVEITFSIRKGENLARQTSLKDSITMNLGKSAASFSESDFEGFCSLFYLKTSYTQYIFRLIRTPPLTTYSTAPADRANDHLVITDAVSNLKAVFFRLNKVYYWLNLTACQPVWVYFMPTVKKLPTFYICMFCVVSCVFAHCDMISSTSILEIYLFYL